MRHPFLAKAMTMTMAIVGLSAARLSVGGPFDEPASPKATETKTWHALAICAKPKGSWEQVAWRACLRKHGFTDPIMVMLGQWKPVQTRW